jgi:3-oxoacyl-[acyl-carrier protein] reductase
MNKSLSNKTALVCGSTQGIGMATAIKLADMGANVILVARNEEKLKEVKQKLSTIYLKKEVFALLKQVFLDQVKLK